MTEIPIETVRLSLTIRPLPGLVLLESLGRFGGIRVIGAEHLINGVLYLWNRFSFFKHAKRLQRLILAGASASGMLVLKTVQVAFVAGTHVAAAIAEYLRQNLRYLPGYLIGLGCLPSK